MALGLPAGRQGEAAIAHHDRGDAVPARAGAQRIPEVLGVHVRVAIDEPRRDHVTVGVDDRARGLSNTTERRDVAVTDRHVGAVAGKSGSVDHRAVLDDQVVRHRALLNGAPPRGGSGPTEGGARECGRIVRQFGASGQMKVEIERATRRRFRIDG